MRRLESLQGHSCTTMRWGCRCRWHYLMPSVASWDAQCTPCCLEKKQGTGSLYLAWWCHSNAPDEWVEEAKLALEHGYTTCKYKARPWWDIVEQVEAVTAVVPPDFKMDLDFNATLCNSASALPVLKALEQYPNVAMIESPIPQDDIQGNQQLRAAQSKPIAMHFGTPGFLEGIRNNLPDAFVIGGGASLMLQHSALAEEANIPFWLQLVGSGITTAWAVRAACTAVHAL